MSIELASIAVGHSTLRRSRRFWNSRVMGSNDGMLISGSFTRFWAHSAAADLSLDFRGTSRTRGRRINRRQRITGGGRDSIAVRARSICRSSTPAISSGS